MTQASLNLFNNHDIYIPVLLMDPNHGHYSTSDLWRVLSAPMWKNTFLRRTKSQELCRTLGFAQEKSKDQNTTKA
jgi:hypothetical protein